MTAASVQSSNRQLHQGQRPRQPAMAREFWLIVLAFVFPWITVWIECGFFSIQFLINVLLCLITFNLGATLHAIFIVLQNRYEPSRQGYVVPADEEAHVHCHPESRPCAGASTPRAPAPSAPSQSAGPSKKSAAASSAAPTQVPAPNTPTPSASAQAGSSDETASLAPPPYAEITPKSPALESGAPAAFDNKVQRN